MFRTTEKVHVCRVDWSGILQSIVSRHVSMYGARYAVNREIFIIKIFVFECLLKFIFVMGAHLISFVVLASYENDLTTKIS